jgi:SNF2 family DNA or RNA helicase
LILQWAHEIKRVSKDLIVSIYYGEKRRFGGDIEYINGILTRKSKVFADTEDTARTAIITAFRTLNSRHGPIALQKHRIEEAMKSGSFISRKEAKVHVTSPYNLEEPPNPDEWERDLSRCFVRVYVDEAHELRNKEAQTWIALRWLDPTYRHLFSATPLMQGLPDLVGLISQLLPASRMWNEKSLDELGVFDVVRYDTSDDEDDSDENEETVKTFDVQKYIERFDPWTLPNDHPAVILRFTPESIRRHILSSEHRSHAEQGYRMRLILKECMLRRTFDSFVDGKLIGSVLPPLQVMNINVRFTPSEKVIYDSIYRDALRYLQP